MGFVIGRNHMIYYELVPDDVATVVAHFSNGTNKSFAVSNNYVEIPESGPRRASSSGYAVVENVTWRNARGTVVR